MICADYMIEGLEKIFTEIEQKRMQGVPVMNKALAVKAIGFAPWNNNCLGVMLTPWFMNLMLLPAEADDWEYIAFGEKITHAFPSGLYVFTMGYEEGIGRYQMCSLFSPMFDFADQEAAVATAQAVLEGLMSEDNRDKTSTRANEIEQIWNGEETVETSEISDGLSEVDLTEEARAKKLLAEDVQVEPPTLEERLEKPISRRELLRANFLRDS